MSLLVVGSVAFDTIHSPHGDRERAMGGSAAYFSFSASFFTDVRLVGVVGGDFPQEYRDLLASRPINLDGLVTKEDGKTFHWTGRYHKDMNVRDTLDIEFNVLADFSPELPDAYKDTEYVFLANDTPKTQMAVLEQCSAPKLVVCDTMNCWIERERNELVELLGKVDGIVLNDEETRMLTGCSNLIEGGVEILKMGPKIVIVKKGEHGALLVAAGEGEPHENPMLLPMPALPLRNVVDPTGAGDSFAGGMMGYLASVGEMGFEQLKRSLAYGTVMASINVEGFSLDRLRLTDQDQIDERYKLLARMLEL